MVVLYLPHYDRALKFISPKKNSGLNRSEIKTLIGVDRADYIWTCAEKIGKQFQGIEVMFGGGFSLGAKLSQTPRSWPKIGQILKAHHPSAIISNGLYRNHWTFKLNLLEEDAEVFLKRAEEEQTEERLDDRGIKIVQVFSYSAFTRPSMTKLFPFSIERDVYNRVTLSEALEKPNITLLKLSRNEKINEKSSNKPVVLDQKSMASHLDVFFHYVATRNPSTKEYFRVKKSGDSYIHPETKERLDSKDLCIIPTDPCPTLGPGKFTTSLNDFNGGECTIPGTTTLIKLTNPNYIYNLKEKAKQNNAKGEKRDKLDQLVSILLDASV